MKHHGHPGQPPSWSLSERKAATRCPEVLHLPVQLRRLPPGVFAASDLALRGSIGIGRFSFWPFGQVI